MISRRMFLIGTGGALVAAGAGIGVSLLTPFEDTFLRARLTELIGPFNMSQKEFKKFEHNFMASLRPKQKLLVKALDTFEVTETNLSIIDTRIEEIDRRLMTDFILSTHMLIMKPDQELFFGDKNIVCNNPFATLTPPNHLDT